MSITPELDAGSATRAPSEGLVDVALRRRRVSDRRAAASPRPTSGLCRISVRPRGARSGGGSRARSALASSVTRARRHAPGARRVLRRSSGGSSTCRSTCASPPSHERCCASSPACRTGARPRTARSRTRSAGRGSPRSRHRHEPQPDPDRAALPPRRRLERLVDRLRGRSRPEAEAAAAGGRDPDVTRGVVVGGGFGGLLRGPRGSAAQT